MRPVRNPAAHQPVARLWQALEYRTLPAEPRAVRNLCRPQLDDCAA